MAYNDPQIQTLKNDGAVPSYCMFISAALVPFIIDSKENSKGNPADQMVYYLQQNVAILFQISKQICSVVPQVAIPSTPPFLDFSPSSLDVRVNAFWFMALIFSLSTALITTLVQKGVRDYMRVFQRDGGPLKSARIRFERRLRRMIHAVVVGTVPSLLHVSLFLFFAGLVDIVLHINTTVGLSTAVPIGICAFLWSYLVSSPNAAWPEIHGS